MGLYEKGLTDTDETDPNQQRNRKIAVELQKLLEETDSLIQGSREDLSKVVEEEGKKIISLICQLQAMLAKLEQLKADKDDIQKIQKIKQETKGVITDLKQRGKQFFKIILTIEKRLQET